jgi:plasmid maintenance system antidote protein VapI
VLEKRGISADTALRLARCFGTSAEVGAGLQADYDLLMARCQKQKEIEREVALLADASRDGSRSEPELEAALPHRHLREVGLGPPARRA